MIKIRRRWTAVTLIALLIFVIASIVAWAYGHNKKPISISTSPNVKTAVAVAPVTHQATYTSKLIFMGDTMLARSIGQSIVNGLNPYSHIQSTLDGYGARIANVETTIAEPGLSIQAQGKTFTFNAPISGIQTLKNANITVAGLANNHTRDYGAAATANMLDNLHTAHILTVGAGKTVADAFAPLVIEIPAKPTIASDKAHSIRVAIIALNDIENSFTNVALNNPGSAYFDKDRVKTAIKLARTVNEADIVVIFPHWGIEYQATPSARQQEWGHFFIDSGADIVIGGHPHVIQPTETYNGKYIVYSLGNFIFDQMTGDAAHGQMIALNIELKGRVTANDALDTSTRSITLSAPKSLPTVLDAQGFPSLE